MLEGILKGREEREAHLNRVMSVRRRVKSVPLVAYDTKDFPALQRLYDDYHGAENVREEDLELFEKKIREYT